MLEVEQVPGTKVKALQAPVHIEEETKLVDPVKLLKLRICALSVAKKAYQTSSSSAPAQAVWSTAEAVAAVTVPWVTIAQEVSVLTYKNWASVHSSFAGGVGASAQVIAKSKVTPGSPLIQFPT